MVGLFLLHKLLILRHLQKVLIFNYMAVILNRNRSMVKARLMMVHLCEVGVGVTHHRCDT